VAGMHFSSNSDTEVLLNSYIYWGEDCLNHFNGMWAFFIYDRHQKRVFASRDRFGIKPFYYIQTEKFLAFASEIPPLLSIIEGRPEPDYKSIFDYLVFNRTDQSERTFFSNIKKLQHGHCFSFDLKTESNSNICFRKWYDLREKVSNAIGFQEPDEFRQLLTSSIALRLRSDVPVGVCLSGGLDSSSIVSLLLKVFDKTDLNTFSAIYNDGQVGDEKEFINEYKDSVQNMFFTTPDATTLGDDLIQFVNAHAEPIPTTSPYAQFKVMKLAREKVVVTLDGQGADEELAGYH
jgi:asparagine synthase (glutamine-hydrolysing)